MRERSVQWHRPCLEAEGQWLLAVCNRLHRKDMVQECLVKVFQVNFSGKDTQKCMAGLGNYLCKVGGEK